ncbi:MAG: glucose-6-phosphate isomerase [Methylobacterium mesophilicum]|nr:glucose-6-phosphate isomerase [Methylobacterium mesophilicum]
MRGASGRYEKRLSDLDGLYLDGAAYKALLSEMGDAVVYEVGDFRPSAVAGDMIFGLTRMVPGLVGEEFFLTRGHIHANADRPEVYYGQKGHGLMQLESPEGETRIVQIAPQTICYVPPFWIHRSVNIGSEELVMMFAYPADSGQDYGIIERSGGMRHRVMRDGKNGWKLVDNAAYKPRAPEVVASLTSAAA